MSSKDNLPSYKAKTDLAVGDITVLGTVTAVKISKSGKTMTVTVISGSGHKFTDRITTRGNIMTWPQDK